MVAKPEPLPKPSIDELDRLTEELEKLRGLRYRLEPGDEEGMADLQAQMKDVARQLRRQADALELHRERTLLRMRIERLEARRAEILEVQADPTRELSYLKGPETIEGVDSDLRSATARLARLMEETTL